MPKSKTMDEFLEALEDWVISQCHIAIAMHEDKDCETLERVATSEKGVLLEALSALIQARRD